MNPDDHREQLIDMLLREHVGSETPPDVRSRVLEALQSDQRVAAGARPSFAQRRIVALPKRSIAGPLKAIAALIMLVAAALGLLHFQNIADERTPQLGSVEGRITGELHSGKSLSTGPDSSAELVYSDGTRVTLGPESAISIPELGLSDRSKVLEIHRGALTASVAPQPSGFPMEFSALHAKAVVVGTELSFRTDASATRLEVTEGTVELHPGDGRAPIEVTTGRFAETDASMNSSSGDIITLPDNRITGFVLMNADTDQPIDPTFLTDGQTLSLSSLPTRKLSLRADFAGDRPFNVAFETVRKDGRPSGIKLEHPQHRPPYFVTGDHSQEQRPADCRPWTPAPGTYRFTARPTYSKGGAVVAEATLTLELTFVP